ncbi:MAG: formate--tetrahydrofolate ligase, partial [Roseiflexaceae bacterium]
MQTDLEIAQAATLRPITDIASGLGIESAYVEQYGRHMAKIDTAAIHGARKARYVVVTAITPTPLGEGKTTTTIGLGQALSKRGHRAVVAIRQPSMGPTFGIKG